MKKNNEDNLREFNNLIWLGLDKVVRIGVGVIVGVWIARYFGPKIYGELNYAVALIGILSTISLLGMQSTLTPELVRAEEGQKEAIFFSALIVCAGVGIILYFAIGLLFYFSDWNSSIYLKIYSCCLTFKCLDLSSSWYEAKTKSKYYVWSQNSVFLFFSILKFFAIYTKQSYQFIVCLILIEALFSGLIGFVTLRRVDFRFDKFSASVECMKSIVKTSWPFALSTMAIMMYMRLDQLMLSSLKGSEEVGIYSAALRLSEVWYFVPTAIMSTFLPVLVRLRKENRILYAIKIRNILTTLFWSGFFLSAFFSFFSKEIVALFFGSEFRGSAEILSVHIWCSIFVFMGIVSTSWFLLEGKPFLNLQRVVYGLILNALLNLVLIPKYSGLGAAYATLISQGFINLLFDFMQKQSRPLFFLKLSCANPLPILMDSKFRS